MDSSGDSEAHESEESRVFRLATGASLERRNFDNLRTPEGWQDHLISRMFEIAICADENTAAAIVKDIHLRSAFEINIRSASIPPKRTLRLLTKKSTLLKTETHTLHSGKSANDRLMMPFMVNGNQSSHQQVSQHKNGTQYRLRT